MRAAGLSIYYYNLDFTNAQVGSIRTTSHMDGTTSDEFTLRFATATLYIFPASTTFTQVITNDAMIYDDSPPDRPMLRPGPITALPFAFLQLNGINGGSDHQGTRRRVCCVRLRMGAPIEAPTPTPAGLTLANCDSSPKLTRGSPTLLQRLSDPTLISNGILKLSSASSGGSFVQYQSIAFINALVSSYLYDHAGWNGV